MNPGYLCKGKYVAHPQGFKIKKTEVIGRTKRDKAKDVEMKVPPGVEEYWVKIVGTLRSG